MISPGHIQFYPCWIHTSSYMFNTPTYAYLLTKCFPLWIWKSLLQTIVTVSLETIKRIIIPICLFQLCSTVIMKQSFLIFKPLKKMHFNNNQQEFKQAKRRIAYPPTFFMFKIGQMNTPYGTNEMELNAIKSCNLNFKKIISWCALGFMNSLLLNVRFKLIFSKFHSSFAFILLFFHSSYEMSHFLSNIKDYLPCNLYM